MTNEPHLRDELVTLLQARMPPADEDLAPLIAAPVSTGVRSSAVRVACSNGHVSALRLMRSAGWSLDDDLGHAAALAARGGYVDVLRLLSQEEVSVRKHDDEALVMAAAGGSEEAVSLLLRLGCNPRAQSEGPLLAAMSGGHVGVARLLLDAGAVIKGIEADALRELCGISMMPALEGLQMLEGQVPDEMFSSIALPLCGARGDKAAVAYLLERGCSPTLDECRAIRVSVNADQMPCALLMLDHAVRSGQFTRGHAAALARSGYDVIAEIGSFEIDNA